MPQVSHPCIMVATPGFGFTSTFRVLLEMYFVIIGLLHKLFMYHWATGKNYPLPLLLLSVITEAKRRKERILCSLWCAGTVTRADHRHQLIYRFWKRSIISQIWTNWLLKGLTDFIWSHGCSCWPSVGRTSVGEKVRGDGWYIETAGSWTMELPAPAAHGCLSRQK